MRPVLEEDDSFVSVTERLEGKAKQERSPIKRLREQSGFDLRKSSSHHTKTISTLRLEKLLFSDFLTIRIPLTYLFCQGI